MPNNILKIQNQRKSTEDEFWSNVIKTDSCWIWNGKLNNKGYGVFCYDGLQLAHRISWRLANGRIPPRMVIMHKCDNPSCINPDHLKLGTHLDNTRDMITKGRGKFGCTYDMHANFRAKTRSVQAEKLTIHELLKIESMRNDGIPWEEISELFKIKPTSRNYKVVLRKLSNVNLSKKYGIVA